MAIVIIDINDSKFSINGVEYSKHFLSVVSNNNLKIINTYDSSVILQVNADYSEYTVDGNTYASVELLQSALLGVLFSRDLESIEQKIESFENGLIYPIPQPGNTPANEPAPTVNGIYTVTVLNDTYTNFGGIVVPDTTGIEYKIQVSGLPSTPVYTLLENDLNIEFDAVPTIGSENTVKSGGVYDFTLELTSIQTDITGTLITGLLNPDGTRTNSANWRITPVTSIKANKGFLFNATAYPAQPTYATIIIYDDLDVIQEVIYSNDVRLGTVLTFDYDYKIQCCGRQTGSDTVEVIKYDYVKNIAVDLESQVSANTSSIDENTSSISAINENPYLGETKTNYPFPNAGYINSSGVYTANVNYETTDLLDIGDFYATYDFRLVVLSASAINFYDEFGAWMSAESAVYEEDGVFVDRLIEKPSGSKYVRVSNKVTYTDKEVYINNQKLEIEFNKLGNPNRFYNYDVANFGDSITWYDGNILGPSINGGTGGSVLCVGYIQILANTLGFNSYDNQGASGKSITTENWVQISAYDFSGIDLATIAHGTNDFKLNRDIGTIGSITDTVFNTDTFYGAYRTVLNAIKTSNTNCEVFLLTPIQRDNAGYTIESTNTAGHKLEDYVNAIKELGKMYSLKVIDLYGESGVNFYNVFDFTIDGLHANNAGHLKMGNSVLREIK